MMFRNRAVLRRVRPLALAAIGATSACGDPGTADVAVADVHELVQVAAPSLRASFAAVPAAGWMVAIHPAEAHAEPGAPVAFVLDVRDPAGNHVVPGRGAVNPFTNAAATTDAFATSWSVLHSDGSAAGADVATISTPSNGRARVVVNDPDVKQVRVVARVVPKGAGSAAVTDTAVLHVDSPATSPAVDRVAASGIGVPLVAMLDGCTAPASDETAVYSALYSFLRSRQLGANMTGQGCERSVEFALFSTAHRLQFRDMKTLQATEQTIWTDVDGDVLDVSELSWEEPDTIYLRVYFFFADNTTPVRADSLMQLGWSQFNKANSIFSESRLGMRFDTVRANEFGPVPPGLTPHNACGSGTVSNPLELPVDLGLVVAFVEAPQHGAWICDKHPAGRLIFVNLRLARDESLAHEIGHALSHEDIALDGHVGHSGVTIQGFSRTNLMHEPMPSHPREFLTIGQVFRFNVDTGSWYQRDPAIMARHPGRACGCQPYAQDVCPPLHRDVLELPVDSPRLYRCRSND